MLNEMMYLNVATVFLPCVIKLQNKHVNACFPLGTSQAEFTRHGSWMLYNSSDLLDIRHPKLYIKSFLL